MQDKDSEQRSAEYYRARAAEMLEKAQSAPTKAVRLAYLNLAQKWTAEAEKLEGGTEPSSKTSPED